VPTDTTTNNTKKVLSLNFYFSFSLLTKYYSLTINDYLTNDYQIRRKEKMFEGIGGAIQLSIIDMTLVFLILGGLALVMVLLKNIVEIKETKKISKETKIVPPVSTNSIKENKEVEGKLVALITAAVASYLEKPKSEIKILHLKKYKPSVISPWTTLGRQELMLGKNIKY
jgi:Na+-transporting methylmalonyl-CoA/oxaloacetate decarboxylase gamma subunit